MTLHNHMFVINTFNFHFSELIPAPKVTDKTAFEVEKVVRTRKRGKKTEYLVKYAHYPSSFNRWITDKEWVHGANK